MPAADGDGISTIELSRKGGAAPIAALGTRTGQFFVVCCDDHPLQAPVAVSAFQTTRR